MLKIDFKNELFFSEDFSMTQPINNLQILSTNHYFYLC
jgi:hypothetical protein